MQRLTRRAHCWGFSRPWLVSVSTKGPTTEVSLVLWHIHLCSKFFHLPVFSVYLHNNIKWCLMNQWGLTATTDQRTLQWQHLSGTPKMLSSQRLPRHKAKQHFFQDAISYCPLYFLFTTLRSSVGPGSLLLLARAFFRWTYFTILHIQCKGWGRWLKKCRILGKGQMFLFFFIIKNLTYYACLLNSIKYVFLCLFQFFFWKWPFWAKAWFQKSAHRGIMTIA